MPIHTWSASYSSQDYLTPEHLLAHVLLWLGPPARLLTYHLKIMSAAHQCAISIPTCRCLGIPSVVLPDNAARDYSSDRCLSPNGFSCPFVVLPRNALHVGMSKAHFHTLVVLPSSFLMDKHGTSCVQLSISSRI
jgi:hypothetical protein